MTPAERQAKLEAAKALMSEVEADGVPASPIAKTVAQSAIPSATPIPFPTKAAVAAQAMTPEAQAVAASMGFKPTTNPALPASPQAPKATQVPAPVGTIEAHASKTQPSVWSTLQKVAGLMKGRKS